MQCVREVGFDDEERLGQIDVGERAGTVQVVQPRVQPDGASDRSMRSCSTD
jgi:hypothetical protein